jgi:hypothetical protein
MLMVAVVLMRILSMSNILALALGAVDFAQIDFFVGAILVDSITRFIQYAIDWR